MPARSERSASARASASEGRGRGKGIAVVWGEFNPELTVEMRTRAKRAIEEAGFTAQPLVPVSGVYDLPFAVDLALQRKDVVAAVAIGCIITGETKHDELIGHASAKALLDVSIARGKPVGLGVTGPGQTDAQALSRVDRAEAAVAAVVKLLDAQRRTAGKAR